MLKTLFFGLGLALAAPAAFAQTAPAAPVAKVPQYEYCLLVASSTYYNARLEFGQRLKDAPENPALIQADVAVRKLRSVVAALNYMSGQGWECINVTTVADNTANPDISYLLRRAR